MRIKITLLLLLAPFITFAQGPWEFNTASDFEGWTATHGNAGAVATLTSNGSDLGYLTISGTGVQKRNPKFTRVGANIDGDTYNSIEIRIKNGSGATFLRLTDGSTNGFSITGGDSEYQVYNLPLANTGTIADISFEFKTDNSTGNGANYVPPSAGLAIDIDYIRPSNLVVPTVNSFTFDTTDEGFNSLTRASSAQTTESSNAVLQVTATTANANNYKVGLDLATAKVDGTVNKYAHITLKNNSSNTLFVLAGSANNYSPVQAFTSEDTEYTTYDFDLTGWTGDQNPVLNFGLKDTWSNVGVYAMDDEVIVANSTYKNLTGTNTATSPKDDAVNWVIVGVIGDALDLVGSVFIDSILFDTSAGAVLGVDVVNLDSDVLVKAFPNPVIDILTISSSDEIKEVSVYSILGSLVNRVSVYSDVSNLDMSFLSKGIYIIKVTTGKGVYSQRIFKN